MFNRWDTGWLQHLQPDENLPLEDFTASFPWYNSAWLQKALKNNGGDAAHAHLRQFVDNPYLLHWLLNREIIVDETEPAIEGLKSVESQSLAAAQEKEAVLLEEDELEEVAERAAEWLTEEDISVEESSEELEESYVSPEIQPSPEDPELVTTTSVEPIIAEAETELPIADEQEEAMLETPPAAEAKSEAEPLINARVGMALKEAAAALKGNESPDAGNLPAFQPHHTIDYFESIGIHFKEGFTKDKFQTQVKSFTQWLKSMKQINYQTGNVEEDLAVTRKAIASLAVDLVKTETMADVLVKQGKNAEAAAIFTELQLLYPDKSAYFAARLEKLKQI